MSVTVHPRELREVKERLNALLANPCDESAINAVQAVRRVFRILGFFDEVVQEQAPPKVPAEVLAGAETKSVTAKQYGYTGEACRRCAGFRVKRTGTCSTCEDCFSNEGCG